MVRSFLLYSWIDYAYLCTLMAGTGSRSIPFRRGTFQSFAKFRSSQHLLALLLLCNPRGVFRIGFRDSGNPSKKKKKKNREAARAAAGSRQDTKSNVEDLPVHSAGMARSCVMTQLVILPAHRTCHFSALNQPNYLARNAKNQAFRSLIFKIFRGSMPPDPPRGLGLRPHVTASRSLYQKLTNRKPLKSPPQIRPWTRTRHLGKTSGEKPSLHATANSEYTQPLM